MTKLSLIETTRIILNEINMATVKERLVDSGKLPENIFNDIVKVSNGNGHYAAWLGVNVVHKTVLPEDIYKFEDYFKTFKNEKRYFPLEKRSIHYYKGSKGLRDFIESVTEVDERKLEFQGQDGGKNLLNISKIEELKSVGIDFVGTVDGYQCFEVPKELSNDEEAYRVYRKHLANCGGWSSEDENVGGKISICTMGSFSHFSSILKNGNFYVFFNLNDTDAPYQFQYESNQFKNRKDQEIYF